MLKNKVLTLGATVVMGFTSLGFTQFVAHADTLKSGDTVVSYQAPQPKDWAVSVPATVNLVVDKSYSDCLQANAKLAIVSSDGVSPFKDTSSHTFTISGKFKTAVRKVPNQKYYQYCYVNNKDSNEQVPGAFRIFAQDVNPTDWGTSGGLYTADVSKLENIQIRSSNSEIPVRFVQFKGNKVELEKANKNGYGLSARIMWTASESTPN